MPDPSPPVTAFLTDSIGGGFLGTGYSISCSTGEAVSISNARMLKSCYYDNSGMRTGFLAAVLQAPGLSGNGGGSVMTRMSYAPGGIPVRSESVFPDGRQLISEIVPTVAGLPSLVTETLAGGSGDGWAHTTSYAYDPFGRISSTRVSMDGNTVSPLASIVSGFDETGNVNSISYGPGSGNSITRSITRDIRGAVSGWSMPGFGQSLAYGDGGAVADWCGRITAGTTETGGYRGSYDYTYSSLGFLRRAAFSSSTHPGMDFSASYDYDRQANLTYMTRSGMLPGNRSGTVADVSVTRKGNRISRVYVNNSTADVPVENQPQITASGTGCTYDNNGNLTSDPSRGIREIEWGETGKPLRVSFSSSEEIRYRYAATGEKLSEEFADADGTTLRRRDIYGSHEFTDGSLDRIQVEGGYLDNKGVFHVYVNDYRGNVIGVVNAGTGETVQSSDYYPYGIPHATAQHPEANRRKFGGREYSSEFGFSSCDFGARLYSPLLCGFDSPDSRASDYPHISPYAYCAADPVNLIDPTGEIPTALEGAYIANHVYDGKPGDVLYGGWRMIRCYTSRESISFRGGLYQKRHENGTIEYAFATAGTYPLYTIRGIKSLGEDFSQPFGRSIDMRTSIRIADKLSKSYPNNELTFVGHSKAGAEAEANAYKTGRNALLYNPAALRTEKYDLDSSSYAGVNGIGIRVYVVDGEFLTYINNVTKTLIPSSSTTHKTIFVFKGVTGGLFEKHKIGTMIETLKNYGYD